MFGSHSEKRGALQPHDVLPNSVLVEPSAQAVHGRPPLALKKPLLHAHRPPVSEELGGLRRAGWGGGQGGALCRGPARAACARAATAAS